MTTDNQANLSGQGLSGSARERIIAAFNGMVLRRQKGPFRVGDIVRHARVARSTFYDHFGSEAALQLTALAGPFAQIADTLTERGDRAQLTLWLGHFWEYRQQARPILEGRERSKVERKLVGLLAERLSPASVATPADITLHAIQIAAATLATLHAWLTGAFAMAPAALADQLVATARSIRAGASQI